MNKQLEFKSKEWKDLPRNNATDIIQADRFYDEEVFPLVAEKFLNNYNYGLEYDLMYVTVGTSWQPIALSILLHKPKNVIFLMTDDVKDRVAMTIEYLKDKLYHYEMIVIDKGNSQKMLKEIRDSFSYYGSPKSCCIDITGGTKAMAAAAAMGAACNNIEISYIESNYLPIYRHPDPGSEKIVSIMRPYDFDIQKAVN